MDEKVKIVCTCIPGFENISIKECEEKLLVIAGTNVRGRIYFEMKICDISELQKLRSVCHYWVVVSEHSNYFVSFQNTEQIFASLAQLPREINWEKALRTWKEFKMKYEIKTKNVIMDEKAATKEEGCDEKDKTNKPISSVDLADIDPLTAGEKLSFRVTATRTGKHIFTSMDSAVHFGGGINETFYWKVDMTQFDIEVVLYVLNNDMSIGIQLTKDDQSSRNITHFGPTTLKANICYSLLQYAQVSPGDVVCDPMCGSGSISIEGALTCPHTFHISGENHPFAIEHSSDNANVVEKEKGETATLPIAFVRWDVYQLPIRTGSVDKIVTDLPFGKRIGNKGRNMFLYPVALREMARICRPRGKAVLLTHHKAALAKAAKSSFYWKQIDVRKICMGGLDVVVYLLARTDEVFPEQSVMFDTVLSQQTVVDPQINQDVKKLTLS